MPTYAQRFYGEGVHEITSTLVIPQKHTGMGLVKIPPPLTTTSDSLPSGHIFGKDWASSVLLFDNSITDYFIKTEYYGTDAAGRFWNNNNLGGNTFQRTSLAGSMANIAVIGKAQLHAYPYSYNTTPPDIYGPDFIFKSDGLCIQAPGFRGNYLRFSQIPGTAIRLKQATGTQDGNYNAYDSDFSMMDWIKINSSMYGIVDETTDGKWDHIFISGVVKDGFTGGNSTNLTNSHIYGADRSLVCAGKLEGENLYCEAARIGTHVTSQAFGTKIRGLNIGPGTCTSRGILVDTHGVEITGINNIVRAEDATYPDVAGLELSSGVLNGVFQGALEINGTSTGFKIRGHRHRINMDGGAWGTSANGRLVEVLEASTRCDIDIKGNIVGGVALDLTSSNLNNINGKGNKFNIRVDCTGGAIPIKYPGGGSVYNLAPGNELFIDGVLQS